MSDIVFYHNPQSRGRIVHWMLEEVGAPYRIELLSFEARDHKKPEYLAVNPMGKIPAIVHKGVVVTEVAAICAYLADAFPQAQLAPPSNDATRGTYLRWLFFAAGCVEPAVVDRMLARPPASRPEALGYGSYADVMNALEQAIAPGPFILRDRFSAADVYLASQLSWGMMVKGIESRATFQAYVASCQERAAFKRFSAQSEQLK
ncbi:MAG: glutathione S-transferase family protein [Steroidobacteraceae bacterium]